MTGPTAATHGRHDSPALPPVLELAVRWGSRAFAIAVALVALAFVTNPEPTADLLGVGLPVTLPVTQPKTGHSALSYLVGMWLWEFTFPFALLAAYRRWGRTLRRERRLLLGVPVAYMATLFVYCASVYVPNVSPAPLGPAATAACWAFCATGAPVFGLATALVVAVGALAWLASPRGWSMRWLVTGGFGVLSLPLGVPAIYLAARQRARA